jgi:hypothetical protein
MFFNHEKKVGLGDHFSPGLLYAPLAVLSPGPRLAGTPSKGEIQKRLTLRAPNTLGDL